MKKLIVLILLIALAGGWFYFSKGEEKKLRFMTIKPSRGDVVETVMATGTLVGLNEVSVGAQVNGQLEKLYVKLGDRVKKGDRIADIEQRTQLNAVKMAEAELKIAESSLKEKQALLKKQESEYNRQKKMRAGNATSDADLESAEADLLSTRAAIESSQAQIEKCKVNVDTAKTNLGYTKIVAPMDGVVIGVVTEEGQTVVSAQSAPTIVKLAELDTMTVEAEVSEADVVKVKPGMRSFFTILGLPDQKFDADLRQVEPAPKSESQSTNSSSTSSSSQAIYYNALLDVKNPDGVLRKSMTAEVTIVLGESKDVITLPIVALRKKVEENVFMVHVLRNNKPEPVKVTVGRKDNINYEIVSGLSENDEVIIGNDENSAEAAAMEAHDKKRRRGPPRM